MAPFGWSSRRTVKPTLRSVAASIWCSARSSSSSAPSGAVGKPASTTADPDVSRLRLWADLQHLGAIGEMTQWELDQVAYGPELMLSVGWRLMLQAIDQAAVVRP